MIIAILSYLTYILLAVSHSPMRRIGSIVAVLLCLPVLTMAQEGIEHDNILKVKIGSGYQLDNYLSPSGYTGMQYGLGNEWWQPFRQDTRLGRTGRLRGWAHVGRVDAGLMTYNSRAGNNSYLGVQVAGGWGAYYEWRWLDERLRVHAGPYLEVGCTVREHATNVNKIVSADVAVDVMAMGGVSWSFYGKRTSYRLNYLLRTNVIGFDYLPEYWQSYYEIWTGVPGQARCSGPWNHNTLKHELTIDMQLPHSTWRVGAEHELMSYGTRDLHFMRHQLSIIVGCRWKYRIHANARL